MNKFSQENKVKIVIVLDSLKLRFRLNYSLFIYGINMVEKIFRKLLLKFNDI